jgi:hydroxymethylpyrimidine/phosphomethylpyrimidine kinase
VKIALSIAGSDSGGGAGIQADLLTFAAHGVHGATAITAITAQNTVTVSDWVALDPSMVRAQIEAVVDDMNIGAVKTGMLANAAIVSAVVEAVSGRRLPNLVVDPVMVAKSGDRLLDASAEREYVARLLPLATLVTPNLPEAEALLGGAAIRTPGAMIDAARALGGLGGRGPRAVLLKGGHLENDPQATDILWDGEKIHALTTERIATGNTHGTGCTYSAAITARLSQGASLIDAVRGAKAYLTAAIRASYAPGRGHGPVGHLRAFGPQTPMPGWSIR